MIQITSDPDYVGEIRFTYTVEDLSHNLSNVASVCITVIGSAYQNPANRFDVNNDRSTSPLDVLLIINLLNSKGASLPVEGLPDPPDYVDVNGDKRVDPLDILELINFINKGSLGSGEGLDSIDQAFASDAFYFPLDFNQVDSNTRNPRKPFKLKRGS